MKVALAIAHVWWSALTAGSKERSRKHRQEQEGIYQGEDRGAEGALERALTMQIELAEALGVTRNVLVPMQ